MNEKPSISEHNMDKPIKTLKALKESLSAEEKKALRVATLKQKKFLASLVGPWVRFVHPRVTWYVNQPIVHT